MIHSYFNNYEQIIDITLEIFEVYIIFIENYCLICIILIFFYSFVFLNRTNIVQYLLWQFTHDLHNNISHKVHKNTE
jgi:hypothetical protein